MCCVCSSLVRESRVTKTVAFPFSRASQAARRSGLFVVATRASARTGCRLVFSEQTAIFGSVRPSARDAVAHCAIRSRLGTTTTRRRACSASAVRRAITVLPVPQALTMWPRRCGLFRCLTALSTASCWSGRSVRRSGGSVSRRSGITRVLGSGRRAAPSLRTRAGEEVCTPALPREPYGAALRPAHPAAQERRPCQPAGPSQ